MPDRMPDRLSERMPDRMPEYIQDMTKYMSWHDLTCHGGDHSKKSIF